MSRSYIGSSEEALDVIRAIGERDRLILEFRESIRELLELPDFDGTMETSEIRVAAKRRARKLLYTGIR